MGSSMSLYLLSKLKDILNQRCVSVASGSIFLSHFSERLAECLNLTHLAASKKRSSHHE